MKNTSPNNKIYKTLKSHNAPKIEKIETVAKSVKIKTT